MNTAGADNVTAEPADERVRRMSAAVRTWAAQLIDVSGRNQLLYYRTLRRGTLELTEADPDAVARLLAGSRLRLSDLVDAADEEVFADALRRARTIHKKATEQFEERGIQTMFLALGMATWTTEASAATPASPVLLRPVAMHSSGAAQVDFDLELDGDWEVNETLAHLLRTQYGITLPEDTLGQWADQIGSQPVEQAAEVFGRLAQAAACVPDFRVEQRMVVGTFAYAKQPMVKDLTENIEALAGHDLLSAISGEPAAIRAVAARRAEHVTPELPDLTPPDDEFLILDSDASQSWAINRALAGEPLIIQGPPGTGKSQTIANLIASLAARGKRVLFVAEKRAAIDAVTKRLDQVGLDDLVLDLHGGVGSKRELARELARTLDRHSRIVAPDLGATHAALSRSRHALREHSDALHERREPWGLSLYQIGDRLLGLSDVPDPGIRFSRDELASLPKSAVEEAGEHLRQWAYLVSSDQGEVSPWAGGTIATEGQMREVSGLVDWLANEGVATVQQDLARLSQESGVPPVPGLRGWEPAISALHSVETTLAVLTPDVFSLDLPALRRALRPAAGGWWSRMTAQLFDAGYRRAKARIRSIWRPSGQPTGRQAHDAVGQAQDAVAGWVRLGAVGPPRVPPDLNPVTSRYTNLLARVDELDTVLGGRGLPTLPLPDLRRAVEALAADRRTLQRLPAIHSLETGLARQHCRPLILAARQGRLPAREVRAVFEATWLRSLRAQVWADDPRLSTVTPELQDDHAERFRMADREHLRSTPERIRRSVAERAVAIRNEHPEQDILVRREANKSRRHMPLRRLFADAPDVLTALRPCWTMSPLVVSHILPARPVFDVVIFDEASQVLPADAVPALLRAPQAVVAGDSRQLPPTDFFRAEAEESDDDDEGLTVGFEAILDVLDALLRSTMLTWHYRSEDERLIAFSNHTIYDSALTTFPGPVAEDALGFDQVPHVPGRVTDSRSNADEVERVVERMLEHARSRPEESLGVIAMGSYHANRIEALLRRRLGEEQDPDLDTFFDESRPERAFVKNIERVQGDERDAIILTTGYAKTPEGRLHYRFTGLNHQGGERRLNVAVTRARRRVLVVSSFSHTDMAPGRSSAEGVELLRRYLKYVASQGRDLDGAQQQVPLNPFEADVKRRLEQAGLDLVAQYGTSGYRIDFAVRHPEDPSRWVLAVEADGARYHSSATSRDRDRLRQQVLERLGWRFHRIWSTSWFADPQAEVARVLRSYEEALRVEPVAPEMSRRTLGLPADAPDPRRQSDEPPRQAPRPRLGPRRPITEYSSAELDDLVTWVQSDGRLRTDEELLEELVTELGYRRRGSRIVATLTEAIARHRPGDS